MAPRSTLEQAVQTSRMAIAAQLMEVDIARPPPDWPSQ
jgi:hypothetical protein